MQTATRFTLSNPWRWQLTYAVQGDVVTLSRTWRGNPVSEVTMPRALARQHYAAQLRAGFVAPEKF
ncbi:MAG: hypothetical protein V4597_11765 [Pseudomonadota bacterium]